MKRSKITFAAMVMASVATTLPAFADDAPRLRADVSITKAVVTLGDLVENAGDAAETPVFRAPDPGTTGTLPVENVLRLAASHGITVLDAAGIAAVTVRRGSRAVDAETIETTLREALMARLGILQPEDLSLTLDETVQGMHLSPASNGLMTLMDFEHSALSGRFRAVLAIADAGPAGRIALTGTAYETVAIASLARGVGRGEIVGTNDLVVDRVRRRAVLDGAVRDPADITGLATRRALQPGQPLSPRDFVEPDVVGRGDAITLVYRAPGLSLTARARALQAGARGEIINVINLQSNRTLQGVVTGPGRVDVDTNGPTRVSALGRPDRS